jgi:hypothetical protein
LQDSPNLRGIMSSKACGEPSLLLSVSVLHAMRMAVKAGRAEIDSGGFGAAKPISPRVVVPKAIAEAGSRRIDVGMRLLLCLCFMSPCFTPHDGH